MELNFSEVLGFGWIWNWESELEFSGRIVWKPVAWSDTFYISTEQTGAGEYLWFD